MRSLSVGRGFCVYHDHVKALSRFPNEFQKYSIDAAFENCLGVQKSQPFLHPPVSLSSTYPHLLSSSHSSGYPDISLRLPYV